ncbi:MAG TPA: hypothetical protein VGM50_21110 [Gemmatimonadaceae bacterium]|jgi:hypothetical protein
MRRRIPMFLLLCLVLAQLAATAGAAAAQIGDLTPGARVGIRSLAFDQAAIGGDEWTGVRIPVSF